MFKAEITSLNRLLLASAAALAIVAVPVALHAPFDGGKQAFAAAHAQKGKGAGKMGGKQGAGAGQFKGLGKGQSLEDTIFRSGGVRGGNRSLLETSDDDGDDSDRPAWAQGNRDLNPHAQGGGQPEGAGVKKGDLYGDLYVILRNDNGEPILTPEGWVQPVDADGNLIPLNEEGEVDPQYEDLLIEVEFGRLSIARAPSKVIEHALNEALATIYSADSLKLDAAGRLVAVLPDGTEKTIDSPLENLALYEALMVNGELPGVVLPASTMDMAASFLGGAADKTGELTIDTVVYLNSVLGINVIDGNTTTYFDFSTYIYDRSSVFTGTVTYLQDDDGDGTYEPVTESIMDAVFDGTNYVSKDGGVDGFAQASDDARAVIEFTHEMLVPTATN